MAPSQRPGRPRGDDPEVRAALARGADRIQRRDRGKADLEAAIRAAAAERAAATTAEGNGIGWADAAYLEKIAERVAGCRTVTAHREAGCGAYLARAHHCDLRLEPHCAHRRAGRMVDRFIPLVLDFRRPASGCSPWPTCPPANGPVGTTCYRTHGTASADQRPGRWCHRGSTPRR